MVTRGNQPIPYNNVTIHLLEAKDLPSLDRNGLSDPFCKFRLGTEKFKSRVIKKTLNPQWMEQFEVFLCEYDSKRLEISLWDWDRTMKNELIGRVELDLATYDKGQTYDLWLDLKDKGLRRGSVHLTIRVNETKEINDFSGPPKTRPVHDKQIEDELSVAPPVILPQGASGEAQVGNLSVKILTISNLEMHEPEGKSLYCVLQLGLIRLQTHTIPKTENSELNFDYNFPVDDVHSVLEITVFDRDIKSRTTFLGSLAIPLLKIRSGKNEIFSLKDKKLMKKTKSTIFLQFHFDYDIFRAALQTLRPKTDVPSDLDKKISSQVLVNKVSQIRKVVNLASETLNFIHSLLLWDSIPNSFLAYFVFVFTVFFFQPCWIPISFLLIFLKNFLEKRETDEIEEENVEENVEDVDSLFSAASENSSSSFSSSSSSSIVKFAAAENLLEFLLPKNLNPVRFWSKYLNRENGRKILKNVKNAQNEAFFVQEILEFFAEKFEKIVNVFNFTVPWLSYFAIFLLIGLFFILYFLPLRFFLFFWGTFEFGKGFVGVRGFELLAFLSRVHSKHEAKMYAELH